MQEIITKCLKQFDMRLFEEIGGNVQESREDLGKQKKHFKSFRFAS